MENNHLVFIPYSKEESESFSSLLMDVLERSFYSSEIVIAHDEDDEGCIKAMLPSHFSQSRFIIKKTMRGKDPLSLVFKAWKDFYMDRDLLMVTPGVRLPFFWDIRLKKAAYSLPIIASSSPMCDADEFFFLSKRGNEKVDAEPSVEDADKMAYSLGHRSFFEMPFFLETCAYLRGDALMEVHFPDDSAPHARDILSGFKDNGRVNVVCDHIYVGWEGKRFLSRPGIKAFYQQFLATHPLTFVRCSVKDVVKKEARFSAMPGLYEKPVNLHVLHSWGGGLEKWARDYAEGDRECVNMALKSVASKEAFGHRLALYTSMSDKYPVRTWDLSLPIHSTVINHLEYRRIIRQIIAEFSVDSVIVSSLIGHSLDVLSSGKKTIIVCHDYYPFCPAVNIYFDEVCIFCDLERISACRKENSSNLLGHDPEQTSAAWIRLRDEYVRRIITNKINLVVPTDSVKKNMTRLDPRYNDARFFLIPHGISLKKPAALQQSDMTRKKPVAVVLGQLKKEKGRDLLMQAMEELCKYVDIYLVGAGNEFKAPENQCIKVISEYEYSELPKIIKEIQPDFGLLLSLCTETFSYTLSEFMFFGVPPVATRIGAFAERIEDGVTGFLVEADAISLMTIVRKLIAHPELLEKVRENLSVLQQRSVEDMVSDYNRFLQHSKMQPARYRLNIGIDTGLTEPYMRLHEGFKELNEGYLKLEESYYAIKEAYDHVREEYDVQQKAYKSKVEELETVRTAYEKTIYWKIKKIFSKLQ